MILMWPAIAVTHQLWNQTSGGRVVTVLLLLAMAVIPWAIAATLTIPPGAYRYTAEHQAMSPLLPTVLLLAMLVLRLMPKRNAGRGVTS